MLAEARALVGGLLEQLDLAADSGPEVVVCPPFTALSTVGELLRGSQIRLGGQDVFWKERGAYTGQISPQMLTELGCTHVIVGHSEPRGRFGVAEPDFDQEILDYFGDSDVSVNRKLLAVVASGLTPILCVGETLAERQSNDTDAVVSGQLLRCLQDLSPERAHRIAVAYEPVWAIGTGETCAAKEADRVCGVIRDTVRRLFGGHTADALRVLYGGSVKPDNAADLLGRPNIDGALVGGASLKAVDFAEIVAAA